MRWLVEAADTKTGKDTEMTVEALTEADAERVARYNGLLVSKVCRAGDKPAPLVEYARRAVVVGEPQGLPEFERLVRRARGTRMVGVAFTVGGWATLALAAGWFGYNVVHGGWGNWSNWRDWLPPAAGGAWRVALAGAGAVAAGSVLRLLAAMALAMSAAARGAQVRRDEGGGAVQLGMARVGVGAAQT